MMSHPEVWNVSFRVLLMLQNGLTQDILLVEQLILKHRIDFSKPLRGLLTTTAENNSRIKTIFIGKSVKMNVSQVKTFISMNKIKRREL